MTLKKVSAIFDQLKLEAVEAALQQHGVKGYTVHQVRGRGAYFDSFNRDPLTPHILLEVYTSQACVAEIAQLIFDTASLGFNHGGLVSVVPVEELYWINEGRPCRDSDFEPGLKHAD